MTLIIQFLRLNLLHVQIKADLDVFFYFYQSNTGPRQSGKTTLLQHLFKGYQYVSLENPESRAFAQEDPKGFLETQSYLIYGGEQNQKRRQAVVRKWDDFSL